ncbi:glycosyltransferase family 4 protein [Candidatus Parcubacteria bacterium]|nr:glycosyltransferase family 4 protein [Candidatus Parcubacteria bacterium]
MRVLMTSETYLPSIGGAEIHVENIIKNLRNENYEVKLITNELDPDNKIYDQDVIRVQWNRKNILKIFGLLFRNVKTCDVIHCHYSYRLAMLAAIVGKIRRRPVVVVLHGMGILDHRGYSNNIYKLAHNIYRYLSLKLASKVISTSHDLAGFTYKYISPKKVVIISNGYDHKRFKEDVTVPREYLEKYKDRKTIMTVRRLVPKNGVHFLVETMPYIIKEIPNIKLLILGDGRMRPFIEKRIKSLDISNHVEMLGMVDNEFVPQYLKLTDMVIFPSTAESSSLACAEAMAMGKKIVASKVGGLVELLGKNEERGRFVKLVEWEDSNYDAPKKLSEDVYKKFAKIIVAYLIDEESNQPENALNYARENLSWKAIVEETSKVYETLIKNK